jgi:RNA polymerase sigma-70 factor (ECF subfamily)
VVLDKARDRREVLEQVFERGRDALYRFILVRTGMDRDASDDLLQQTCYEAARHPSPPRSPDDCEAWLRGIARNLVRRRWRTLRRAGKRVPMEDPEEGGRLADALESGPLPEQVLIRKETIEQLMLAVTSLPAADQELVFAFYFHGRSQADLAGELGVSEKAVESRLYRARSRLRTILRSPERSGER